MFKVGQNVRMKPRRNAVIAEDDEGTHRVLSRIDFQDCMEEGQILEIRSYQDGTRYVVQLVCGAQETLTILKAEFYEAELSLA
jgi:hypothetical protein